MTVSDKLKKNNALVPHVKVVPHQAHCFAFGGFDIQMLAALEAARNAGVDVARLDPWSRDADFEIMHFWGLDIGHMANIHWSKQAGKAVIMTALLPYLTPLTWLRSIGARLIGLARQRRKLLSGVDQLVVVNRGQAVTARWMFGVPPGKVTVIPNIVSPCFFKARLVKQKANGHVLCTGNICRRKNQLALVHACRRANLPLLLIGSVLTGEEAYGDDVRNAMQCDVRMRWMPAIAHGSDELIRAYQEASVFALVSKSETQPICLLEAAAVGCPLVIADLPYARQEFYTGAVLVNPNSIDSIVNGLTRAFNHGEGQVTDINNVLACSQELVGQAYAELYRRVNQHHTRAGRQIK